MRSYNHNEVVIGFCSFCVGVTWNLFMLFSFIALHFLEFRATTDYRYHSKHRIYIIDYISDYFCDRFVTLNPLYKLTLIVRYVVEWATSELLCPVVKASPLKRPVVKKAPPLKPKEPEQPKEPEKPKESPEVAPPPDLFSELNSLVSEPQPPPPTLPRLADPPPHQPPPCPADWELEDFNIFFSVELPPYLNGFTQPPTVGGPTFNPDDSALASSSSNVEYFLDLERMRAESSSPNSGMALMQGVPTPSSRQTCQGCSQEKNITLSINREFDFLLATRPGVPETFQNGGEILGHTNIRREEVRTVKNDTTSAHSKRKYAKGTSVITPQMLAELVGKKLEGASEILNISESTFKRILRKYMINKWPFYKDQEECSLVKEKLLSYSNEGTEGLSTRTSHTIVAMQDNSIQSIEGAYVTSSHAGNVMKAIATNSDLAPEQVLTALSPIEPHVGSQDAKIWSIKVRYGEKNYVFTFSSTFGIAKLREEVAKRLKIDPDGFDLKYEDDDKELVSMEVDDDLEVCMGFFTSLAAPKIILFATDTS